VTVVAAAPGWYPDNQDPALVRWWDGTQWTEHTQPARPATPTGPAPGFVPGDGAPGWPPPVQQAAFARHQKIPGRKRDLQAEVERLRQIVDGMGIGQLEELRLETRQLEDELPRLRREHAELLAGLGPMRAEAGLLAGQRANVAALQGELRQLQARRETVPPSAR
jgi:hypothetical protein